MKNSNRTLNVLEWNDILEKLASFATSNVGKEFCLDAKSFNDPKTIEKEQKLTTQAKFLVDSNLHPPLGGIVDIREFLKVSKISALASHELNDVAKTIRASRVMKNFGAKYKQETPFIEEITSDLFENRELEDEILNTFDDKGNVADSASPELKSLRVALRDNNANLKTTLNRMLNSLEKYLQDPVFTMRDERYVLPVKADFKSKVPGIVHDVSASGATFFIEPKNIVELNNRVREIESKIEYEIKKILSELTKKVAQFADEIKYAIENLAQLDFIFAKAKYSVFLNASEPELNDNKYISLKQAKHPVLLTVIDEVVPNDIEIGQNSNCLIITGSNTGGKTVTLKLLGLFVLMTKAGLHIPCEYGSIYPFKNIFADIGDEQSVIQSLSTFSGHILNIVEILNKADNESLIILDELGSGTDPSEGASLAQAILEYLNKKGSKTIISTHYGELKSLAFTKKGFENASVEFDSDTFKPTYKLLLGVPGKSNAITIAKNLGVAKEITDYANEIYLTQKDSSGEVLEGLQNVQRKLSVEAKEATQAKEEIEKLKQEYSVKVEKIKEQKKKTMDSYKSKFQAELEKSRNEIRELMKEIRISKSEKLLRRQANRLSEIEAKHSEFLNIQGEELKPSFEELSWDEMNIGDEVLIKDLNQNATLLTLPDKNNNVQVQAGLLKTTIKKKKLAKVLKKSAQKQEITKTLKNFVFSRNSVSKELDLRGQRVEEGLNNLEKYLDDASLANLSPVYIIHGAGTGALRSAVREYLKNSPYVEKYRAGNSDEGSDGVSVVEII